MGIQPLKSKVNAILKIAEPTNKLQLQSFIGIVNYYRDMWKHQAGLLAPLSELMSDNVPWTWTDVHRQALKNKTGTK